MPAPAFSIRMTVVLFTTLLGCEPAATPPPESPAAADTAAAAAAASCSLENAMLDLVGNARLPVNCGAAPADTLCDDGCRQAIRGCVLESVRARRPFTVAWTNGMNAGVGTRRAVVGRPGTGEGTLDLTWLDLTWIDGYDPDTGSMTKKRVRITRRRCAEIEDVAERCDPRLSVPSAECSSPTLASNAGLRCDAPEEILCAD